MPKPRGGFSSGERKVRGNRHSRQASEIRHRRRAIGEGRSLAPASGGVDGDLGKLRFLLGREMHFHAFKVRESRHSGKRRRSTTGRLMASFSITNNTSAPFRGSAANGLSPWLAPWAIFLRSTSFECGTFPKPNLMPRPLLAASQGLRRCARRRGRRRRGCECGSCGRIRRDRPGGGRLRRR